MVATLMRLLLATILLLVWTLRGTLSHQSYGKEA